MITARAEKFVSFLTFSSGARRDLRACRGIWKKYYPASWALDPERLIWPAHRVVVAYGEASAGKRAFAVFPQVC
jgi:hypothetical protein